MATVLIKIVMALIYHVKLFFMKFRNKIIFLLIPLLLFLGLLGFGLTVFALDSCLPTQEGTTRDCALQEGVCQGSVEWCLGGFWQGCGAPNYGVNYELFELSCDDTLDNDCDGLTDTESGIEDSDCWCTVDFTLAETECNDGIDNDGDTFCDFAGCCDDGSGEPQASCSGTWLEPDLGCNSGQDNSELSANTICGNLVCEFGESCAADCSTEAFCNDGVDNEENGEADCGDSACLGQADGTGRICCSGDAQCGGCQYCQQGLLTEEAEYGNGSTNFINRCEVQINGPSGRLCNNDCSFCDNGFCTNRDEGDTTECTSGFVCDEPPSVTDPPTASCILAITPFIATTFTSLGIEAVNGGAPPNPNTLIISNSGTGILDWTATVDVPWLSLNIANGGNGPTEVIVSYDINGMSVGSNVGTITITDDTATNVPFYITITLTIQAPTIELSPTFFEVEAMEGDTPASQTLTIQNSGDAVLNWLAENLPGWLTILPSGGTVTDGSSENVTLSFSDSLIPDIYTDTFDISDPNASNDPQTADVVLTINSAPLPVISLSQTTFSNSAVEGSSNPADEILTITNSGDSGSILTWSFSDSPPAWLSFIGATSGTLAQGESDNVTLRYDISTLNPSINNFTFDVEDPTAPISPQTVSVDLEITAVPVATISLTPGSFIASADEGSSPANQILNIENSGGVGSTLTWSVSNDQSWLSLSPASGTITAPGSTNVTLNYTTEGLVDGPHSDTITVDAPGATNDPQTASVDLTIINVPVTFLLTVTTDGGGTGSVVTVPSGDINCPGDCNQTYNEGTLVELAASPDGGSTFREWSANCVVNGNGNCEVTMDAARAVTATFDPITECNNGSDDDLDGDIDLLDGGCDGPLDNDETNCGDAVCEGGESCLAASCAVDCVEDIPGGCTTLAGDGPGFCGNEFCDPGAGGTSDNGWICQLRDFDCAGTCGQCTGSGSCEINHNSCTGQCSQCVFNSGPVSYDCEGVFDEQDTYGDPGNNVLCSADEIYVGGDCAGVPCTCNSIGVCVSTADTDLDGLGDPFDVCPYDPDNDFDGDGICAVGCNTGSSQFGSKTNGFICDAGPGTVVYDQCQGVGSCDNSNSCWAAFGASDYLNVYLNGTLVVGNLYLPEVGGYKTAGEIIGNGGNPYPALPVKVYFKPADYNVTSGGSDDVVTFEGLTNTWWDRNISGVFMSVDESGLCDHIDLPQKATDLTTTPTLPVTCYTQDDASDGGFLGPPPSDWQEASFDDTDIALWQIPQPGNNASVPLLSISSSLWDETYSIWGREYSDFPATCGDSPKYCEFSFSHTYCRSEVF